MSATGTKPGGGTVNDTDIVTVTVTQTRTLLLDKTFDAADATYDSTSDVINYSYLVTNTGNVSLAGPVTIGDDKATDGPART